MSKAHETTEHGSLRSYGIGFLLSIICTLAAYQLVVHNVLTGWALISVIMLLAVTQLGIQLLFFLHIASGPKPRLNLIVFVFTLLIVSIVVIGSLWIMSNLHYNMSPGQYEKYLLKDEGIKP